MLKKMRWHFILAAMAAVFIMLVVVLAGINLWNYHNTASRADQRIQEIYTFEAGKATGAEGESGPAADASQNSEIPPVNVANTNTSNPPTGQKLAETQQPENAPARTESAATEQSEDESAQSEQTETQPPAFPGPGQDHDPEAPYTTRFFLVKLDENETVTEVSTDFIASVTQEEAEEYARNILDGKREKCYYKNYRFQIISDNNEKIVIFLNCSMELHSARNVLLISCLMGAVCLLIVFLLVLLLSRRAMEPYIRNMERQKRFITDASHEIKTPLTSIATSVDVIEMEYGTDEWIENIHKQTAKMSRMVADLVTLSRLDEENPFPEKTEFSLSDAAWEVAEPFASLAKAQGKNYTQRIEENLTLWGNPDSIRQLISILLDNALKYSDEHGSIRLDVYKVHGKTKIEVFNTCILEDTKNLSRLFDRFYRLDDSRSKKTGGTGIGLSIAQAVAEAYGGKIKVRSKDGKSILFRVSI